MGFGPRYCALTDFFSDNRGTPVGALRNDDDKIYRFVKNVTGSDLVLGDVVFHGSSDPLFGEVYSFAQSAKGTTNDLMAGVALAAIPSNYYGWVQIYGYNAAVNTLGALLNSYGDRLVGVSGQKYVTKEFSGRIYSAVAASTAVTASGTSDFDTNITLPANTLLAGDIIRVNAQMITTSTTGAETVIFLVRIGTTTLVASAALDATNNDIGHAMVDCVIRTIGAGGTMVAGGIVASGVEPVAQKAAKLASTAIDTTATQKITASVTHSSTGESSRLDIFDVDLIRASGPPPRRHIICNEAFTTASAATKKGFVHCL